MNIDLDAIQLDLLLSLVLREIHHYDNHTRSYGETVSTFTALTKLQAMKDLLNKHIEENNATATS